MIPRSLYISRQISRRAAIAGAGIGAAGLLVPVNAMADGVAHQLVRTINPGETIEETIEDCQADQSADASWLYDYTQAPGALYISTAVRQEGKTCYRALVYNERERIRLRLERCEPAGTTVIAEGPSVPVSSYPGNQVWILRTTVTGSTFEAVLAGVPGMHLSVTDGAITQGSRVTQTFYLSRQAASPTDVIDTDLEVTSSAPAGTDTFSMLLYEDNFDTGTDFDSTYWGEHYPDWNPGYVKYDWGVITHDTHDVRDGVGRILWRKREVPITKWPNEKDKDAGRETVRDVDTASIVTRGKLDFTYGRVEVRARFPQSHVGLWGGIWMRPVSGGDGEIDIAESWGGGASTGKVSADVHYTYDKNVPNRHRPVIVEPWPDLTEFHVFAMEKTPERISFFFDGRMYHEVRSQERPELWAKAFGPGNPYYLRLCSQAGDTPQTRIDTTTFTEAAMEIDYISVWQMDE